MRRISTQVHATLDYIVGILLIAAPWIFNFATGGPAQSIPVILGLATIVMSFFTNYEGGLVKVIPMPVHLTIDLLSGIFLAASPWLFGFAEIVMLPHLIVGILEIVVSLCTEKVPFVSSKYRV